MSGRLSSERPCIASGNTAKMRRNEAEGAVATDESAFLERLGLSIDDPGMTVAASTVATYVFESATSELDPAHQILLANADWLLELLNDGMESEIEPAVFFSVCVLTLLAGGASESSDFSVPPSVAVMGCETVCGGIAKFALRYSDLDGMLPVAKEMHHALSSLLGDPDGRFDPLNIAAAVKTHIASAVGIDRMSGVLSAASPSLYTVSDYLEQLEDYTDRYRVTYVQGVMLALADEYYEILAPAPSVAAETIADVVCMFTHSAPGLSEEYPEAAEAVLSVANALREEALDEPGRVYLDGLLELVGSALPA